MGCLTCCCRLILILTNSNCTCSIVLVILLTVILIVHELTKDRIGHATCTCSWLRMRAATSADSLDPVHVVRGGGLCAISLLSWAFILAKVVIASQLRYPRLVSHLRCDLPHVKLLESWTALKAEFNVAFLVEDQVAIQCQINQLLAIFETWYTFKCSDFIIRQENSLQFWTVVESVNLVDDISS